MTVLKLGEFDSRQPFTLNRNGKGAFSPGDFANLNLWLDSSDTGTITKDGANFISQWGDKSGQGNHAVQASSSLQPRWIPAQQNGFAIINNPATDRMTIPGFGLRNTTDVTMFFVVKSQADQSFKDFIAFGTGTEARIETTGLTVDQSKIYASGIITDGQTIGTKMIGSFHSLNLVTDSSNFTSRENGVQQSTGATLAGGWQAALSTYGIFADINGGRPYVGDLAEIIIYKQTLSPAEIITVENYLNLKWALY